MIDQQPHLTRRALVLGRTFLTDESGATAIEYGLIATLIGVAIIGGATAFGRDLSNTFWCPRAIMIGRPDAGSCQAIGN